MRLNIDSQFQCRQCQDLLENNLAHKRPIEGLCFNFKSGCVYYFLMLRFNLVVLIGKKNLEVRPTAVNKVRFRIIEMWLTEILTLPFFNVINRVRLLSEFFTKTRIRNSYFVLEMTRCVSFFFPFSLSLIIKMLSKP